MLPVFRHGDNSSSMHFHSPLLIDSFDYQLPESRIARYPLEKRDASKLLVYKEKQITEDEFRHIGRYLPEGCLLVSNNTRVVNARLKFKKLSGSTIEIFCIEPREPMEYQLMFTSKGHCTWKCMIGNLKRWKEGSLDKMVVHGSSQVCIRAEKAGIEDEMLLVRFTWDPQELTFGEVLEMTGTTPIPPYLNRESENIDKERYQTVYARHDGSVAAPTAGLHFTEPLLVQLLAANIKSASITLHVGAGTFRPVVSKSVSDHIMHTEHFSISIETVEVLAKHEGKLIATGTTTVRTLESLYLLGLKLLRGEHEMQHEWFVGQWDGLNEQGVLPARQAIQSILDYMIARKMKTLHASTQIMILPGYRFRMIDGMITNFHQPRSTLLLLIGAFVGDDWNKIYDYALEHGFRFLSYGDSSLLIR